MLFAAYWIVLAIDPTIDASGPFRGMVTVALVIDLVRAFSSE